MKRKYTKEDIYDYLLENYGWEWKGFQVYNKCSKRTVRESDCVSDRLTATVLLFNGDARNVVQIKVTNDDFVLAGIEPNNEDASWTEFLAQRHTTKHGVGR